MKLQNDPQAIASKHSGVSTQRAKELIAHLTHVPADELGRVLSAFRANKIPAPELALAEELLGLPAKPVKPAAKSEPAPSKSSGQAKAKS